MRRILAGLAVLALAGLASAQTATCTLTTSSASLTFEALGSQGVTVGSGQAFSTTAYVVNDLCQPSCVFSTWIYLERNGVDGLQRHDGYRDDTCRGLFMADLLVW